MRGAGWEEGIGGGGEQGEEGAKNAQITENIANSVDKYSDRHSVNHTVVCRYPVNRTVVCRHR